MIEISARGFAATSGGNGIGSGSATCSANPAALAVAALIAKADAATINAITVRLFNAFLRLCEFV
ncbi:hypothetical protein [Trinickia sp. EG282A]|uniref:hypothetical protein n=1 Tax=Trinickia sp. EG282A TaxID=3237013 RepID=UPI0034D35A49